MSSSRMRDPNLYLLRFGRSLIKAQYSDLPCSDGLPAAGVKKYVPQASDICPRCNQRKENSRTTGKVCLECLDELQAIHLPRHEKSVSK